ncbi:MAG TPA: GAF domain-containing protein [Prevotella sp.]|nr:GAF domain-containing protein [Prevotella sp.]
MEKEEKYELLCQQITSLVSGEHQAVSVMANVSAALKETFPERFFWVGFYCVNEGELQLGPFQGSVACMHIQKGKGVCGTAWEQKQTIIVPDVEQFPGHIACSSLSRSEIVVPLLDQGNEVYGEIDIDSKELNAFDAVDKRYLEKIAKIISNQLAF